MKDEDAVHAENVEVVAGRPRKARVFLRIGIALGIAALLLLAVLHFSGLIPIHRVPRILTAQFRPPQVPDVAKATKYERAHFTFSYPANWHIDTASEQHNPDKFLIIEAPKRGSVCPGSP